MLYALVDWQRQALAGALALADLPGGRAGPYGALREIAARNLAAGAPRPSRLVQAVRDDAGRAVAVESELETPFVRVLRFAAAGHDRRRRVLLVAPHSGYAAAVTSPLIAGLLPCGEVWVTDWRDSRLVPAAAGRLGLAEQVEVIAGLLAADDRPTHLVGLSQSGAACLLAAARASVAVASLTLLGSPIDGAAARHPWHEMLRSLPRAVAAANLTARVPPGYPGAGRSVYPGLAQLLAYGTASPETYLAVQGGLLADLLAGADRGFRRQHADVHDLIDVPAELLVDMLDWTLYRPASVTREAITFGDVRLGTEALVERPLLTVESELDELVSPGQTHHLGRALGGDRWHRLTIAGGRHHDLFTGPLLAATLVPALRTFLRDAASS